MINQASFTTIAIVIVAFIAGYSVVSFIVRKLREGPFNPDLIGPPRDDRDPSEKQNQSEGRRPNS